MKEFLLALWGGFVFMSIVFMGALPYYYDFNVGIMGTIICTICMIFVDISTLIIIARIIVEIFPFKKP